MTKEDGSEVEEDIYEAYNLGLVSAACSLCALRLAFRVRSALTASSCPRLQFLSGQKSQIPEGQGVRLAGDKMMIVQTQKAQTYVAKIKDAEDNETSYNVTIDDIHVAKKGSVTVLIGVKGGYFFAVKADSSKDPKQTAPNALGAMAIGFYWAVGPDA